MRTNWRIRALLTYPGWHCGHGFVLGTKIQMQDNDGNDNSEDTQADDEQEIHHYRHDVLHYIRLSHHIILRYVTLRYTSVSYTHLTLPTIYSV